MLLMSIKLGTQWQDVYWQKAYRKIQKELSRIISLLTVIFLLTYKSRESWLKNHTHLYITYSINFISIFIRNLLLFVIFK